MGKLNKPQFDRKLTLISKQDKKPQPPRPPSLGESCATTNWDKHIKADHNIKFFVQILDHPTKRGEKVAQPFYPAANEIYVAVKEEMHGYFWIWILIIEQPTGRILQKFTSSTVQFVTWDEEEAKPVLVPTSQVKESE